MFPQFTIRIAHGPFPVGNQHQLEVAGSQVFCVNDPNFNVSGLVCLLKNEHRFKTYIFLLFLLFFFNSSDWKEHGLHMYLVDSTPETRPTFPWVSRETCGELMGPPDDSCMIMFGQLTEYQCNTLHGVLQQTVGLHQSIAVRPTRKKRGYKRDLPQ